MPPPTLNSEEPVCPCWDMSQCVYWRVGQGLKWASLHCGEVTAKPDKTGPRNSSLVSGKLKSRPANPLPIAAGGFVYAPYSCMLVNKRASGLVC